MLDVLGKSHILQQSGMCDFLISRRNVRELEQLFYVTPVKRKVG